MEDIISTLQTIRTLVQERNRFLQDVANLVVQAAESGLDHVDSHILLELMEKHNQQVNKIMDGVSI